MTSKRIRKRLHWALAGVLVAVFAIVSLNYSVIVRFLSPRMEELWGKVTPSMVMTLLAKCGIVSLLTGLVTRWFQNRKDRFINGEIEYRLHTDYALVVGYDFQVKPLVKKLLCSDENLTVLLMTDRDVRRIRLEMATELTKDEVKRLLIMRRDLAIDRSYQSLRVRGAKSIYLMGDEGLPGRDVTLLRASDRLANKAESEPRLETDSAIKVYMHLDDPAVYAQMRSRELSMDIVNKGETLFDLELFNYYDSWVWRCWSVKDSTDGCDAYLPLKFKADAPRVELFVIGNGNAQKAVVDSAITLMNYGCDTRNCKLTVVSDHASAILPPNDAIEAFPELEIAAFPLRDLRNMIFPAMTAAASRSDTSVTVVIAEDTPDMTVKCYLELPFALRTKYVSALLWMNAQSRDLPEKDLLKLDSTKDSGAASLRYFGMSDCLPWYGNHRCEVASSIDYYYDVRDSLPNGTDVGIMSVAKSLWDGEAAYKKWLGRARWKKWSSVNAADSFKEKVALIGGREITPEVLLLLLRAEHNRWWSERLLADWRVGARDNASRLHPNLVPFDELDDVTKDIDKICIASMAQQGFIHG